jgi:hypothetical protein
MALPEKQYITPFFSSRTPTDYKKDVFPAKLALSQRVTSQKTGFS